MSEGNPSQETIFFSHAQFFPSLITDISQAQHSIDLETYIFSEDHLAQQISQALINAAKRGIKIRIIVDGAGTPQWGGELTKQLETAGIQTRVFHPFPWRFWQWSRAKINAPFLLKIIYLFLKINSRNHRKTCVIDNKIAYIGSFNISNNHLDISAASESWRDTAIKLTDVNITALNEAFLATWNHTKIQERIKAFFKHIHQDPRIRLNNSWHRRRILYKNLLRRLNNCKKRVWITNAYFVPDNFLFKKLSNIAKAGIDVKILLPQKSDVLFMPWASSTFYDELLAAGVKIFEYLPTMLHAKSLILDDWMLIGSTNLNHRSLLHDLEVDINVRSKVCKELLEKQFLTDIITAKEIKAENLLQRPLWQRFMGRMLLYVKYWI